MKKYLFLFLVLLVLIISFGCSKETITNNEQIEIIAPPSVGEEEGVNGTTQPNPVTPAPQVADSFQLPFTGNPRVTLSFGGMWSGVPGKKHCGEDRSIGEWTPIYAVANGTVKYAGYMQGYGRVVVIEHILPDNSKVTSLYGHLKSTGLVQQGINITKGTQVGLIANSSENGGWGIHLHWAIRAAAYDPAKSFKGYLYPSDFPEKWVDPTKFVNEHSNPGNPPPQPTEIIVDNNDSGFTRGGTASYWHYQTGIGYNGSMYWTYVNGNVEDNYAIWKPNISGTGNWEVLVYVPNNYGTTRSAKYKIVKSDGATATVAVNQNVYYNVWVSLGTYSLGPSSYVKLSDATGESYSTKYMIAFDAVKFVKR